MSHRSVGTSCQQGAHVGCSGWVESWDTPGQIACSCACHEGRLQFTRARPIPARTTFAR